MAKFYLINSITIASGKLPPGHLFDDTVENTAAIIAAGGILRPATNVRIAAAAVVAAKLKALGRDDSELAEAMQAGIDADDAVLEGAAATSAAAAQVSADAAAAAAATAQTAAGTAQTAANAAAAYTPATPLNWVGPAPTTVAGALDRLAAVVSVSGGTPIP